MKKIGKIILAGVFIVIVMMGVYIYIVPYFTPLEFTDRSKSFRYQVTGNHVEIVRYIGSQEEVTIPERLMGHPVTVLGSSLGIGCFEENMKVKKVEIPNTVTEMNNAIFWGCDNLEEVQLPKGLKKIATKTFIDCDALKDIKLPEGLEMIESGAFSYCDSLTEIVIPDTVQVIEAEAFFSCSNLEKVIIPQGVKEITGDAFEKTPWLEKQTEEFVIAGNNVLIGYTGDDSVVNIPNEITYVGEGLFNKDLTITHVTFPPSVKKLGFWTFFRNEDLKYVVLENDNIILNRSCIYECENVTIVSREGSTGQKYAQENGIPWEELEE
ncbi:MAG: leucine-rich repeat domain-containing protein [Lachnospiraceae bacterium]|nr:leucine-rich repeat domain-containing protein [Lachnospiraceae bacterium]